MANEEKRDSEKKFEDKGWNKFCFGWQSIPEAMAKCCEGMKGQGSSGSMMAGCMKMCRWFPLVAIVFGITFLFLGYCLDASIIRVFWMLFAGCAVVMGTFGLIMMWRMKNICC